MEIRKSQTLDTLTPIALVLIILIGWEIFVILTDMPKYFLPAPSDILIMFGMKFNVILDNTLITIYELTAGFLLAIFVGYLLALSMTAVAFLRRGLYPLLVSFQSLPKVVLAPIILMWFGLGIRSKIVMSFILSFFPIVVNSLSGLVDISPTLLELIHSMRPNKLQIFTKIRIPHSLPFLFDGMKIALPLSMVGAVVGEFIGARKGLGNLILITSDMLKTDFTFACFIVITIVSLALFGVLLLIERKAVWWRKWR